MKDCDDPLDRRKHPRYIPVGCLYTANCTKPGLILDISLGGMAVRYVDRKRWRDESFESCFLDLVCGEDELLLEKLPVRLVADGKVPSRSPDGGLRVRRRSLQFGELTEDQIVRLEHFFIRSAERTEELPHPRVAVAGR